MMGTSLLGAEIGVKVAETISQYDNKYFLVLSQASGCSDQLSEREITTL